MATMIATTRTEKSPKAKVFEPIANKAVHTIAPWTCEHFGDASNIKAYVLAAGDWKTVAKIEQTGSVDAEATASFIVRAVNDHGKMQSLISELVRSLEFCLSCEGLSWEAEREANIVIAHVKQDGLLR